MKTVFANAAIPLALAAGLGAQYDAPFSHGKHLAMGLACTKCHTGATESTKAADNLLPVAAVCKSCHAPGRIKEPSHLTVSKFNHKIHVAVPGLGEAMAAAIRSESYLGPVPEGLANRLAGADQCTACHRGLRDSDRVTKSAFPNMAECLVCHGDVEPPFSCEKCHPTDATLKPASHTTDFLEAHSRPGGLHEKLSCQVCHGRKFTCLGCH